MPTLLLEETDRFITVPVPKVHANTKISVAIKNQWGVIQDPAARLQLHPYFKEVIYQVNRLMPKSLAIVDGRFGLTRSGPLRGNAVELDWLMVSDSILHTDMLVADLMGFDPRRIRYLRHFMKREGVRSWQEAVVSEDPERYRSVRFELRREWTDYPGVFTFNSRLLAYVGYESFLARPLHWLLYRFREPFY
jgi:uncharacterized protein (DUF362 family)